MSSREKRYILRSLFCPGSEKFWRLKSHESRLVYISMILNADDTGRVECDHLSVKSYSPRWYLSTTSASSAIQALVKVGLIRRFQESGKWYAEIFGFKQSQSNHSVTVENNTNMLYSENLEVQQKSSVSKDTDLSKSVSSFKNLDDTDSVFMEAKKKFRRQIGKNLGSLGTRKNEWSGLVRREGAEIVVLALSIWGRENADFVKTLNFPLAHFLKNSGEYIEAAKMAGEPIQEESVAGQAPAVDPPAVEMYSDEWHARQGLVKIMEIRHGKERGFKWVHPSTAESWIQNGYARPLNPGEEFVQ